MVSPQQLLSEWKRNAPANYLGELSQMENDSALLNDCFYQELSFGTAGIRGKMGAGTNRLNTIVVARTTRALIRFLTNLKNGREQAKVAITYDSRNNSKNFAELTAATMQMYGIEVLLTQQPMPVPFVSFLTREENCDMGIVITASHNPKEYNGMKVYAAYGGQITSATADEIADLIANESYFPCFFPEVRWEEINTAAITRRAAQYADLVANASLYPTKGIHIVYTPLNGTGVQFIPQLLQQKNHKVSLVQSQAKMNGNFLTCPSPDPSKPDAMKLALQKAAKEKADLILATDPDADRVGVTVRTEQGYVPLDGNQTGCLLLYYLLQRKDMLGQLPPKPVVIRSFVSLPLADKMIKHYGGKVIVTPIGFKFIGEEMEKMQKAKQGKNFVLAFEESYGCLAGMHARDKDAVMACMLIAEMTEYFLAQGKTLADVLEELFEQFGRFENYVSTVKFEGSEGSKKMNKLLAGLRKQPPSEIAGYAILCAVDYNRGIGDFPKNNAIEYTMSCGAQLILRPSGTEPLMRIYVTVCQNKEKNAEVIEQIKNWLKKLK